jgi:hypothetical protein
MAGLPALRPHALDDLLLQVQLRDGVKHCLGACDPEIAVPFDDHSGVVGKDVALSDRSGRGVHIRHAEYGHLVASICFANDLALRNPVAVHLGLLCRQNKSTRAIPSSVAEVGGKNRLIEGPE